MDASPSSCRTPSACSARSCCPGIHRTGAKTRRGCECSGTLALGWADDYDGCTVNMAYTATKPASYSIYTIVAFTLLALGLLRAAVLVVHEPVLGYGDQQDMHRTADCIGLQAIADAPRAGETFRPHPEYHTAGVKWSGCYPSSSVVFAAPVVIAYAIASIASSEPEILIPLKAFGLFNLLLFGLLGIAIAVSLRPYPVAQVAHAALFFLLIADPVATLWFNTLYTEPSALLGAYGAAGMILVIILSGVQVPWRWCGVPPPPASLPPAPYQLV